MFNSKLSSLQDRLARVTNKLSADHASGRIILDALGGESRVKASTGRNVLISNNYNGVMIQTVPVRGKGVENVKIVLNDDLVTCDVFFYAPLKTPTPKIKKTMKDVPLDVLEGLFEQQTGVVLK